MFFRLHINWFDLGWCFNDHTQIYSSEWIHLAPLRKLPFFGNIQFSELRFMYRLLKIWTEFFSSLCLLNVSVYFVRLNFITMKSAYSITWSIDTLLRLCRCLHATIEQRDVMIKSDKSTSFVNWFFTLAIAYFFPSLLYVRVCVYCFCCLFIYFFLSICCVPPCACFSVIKFICWRTNDKQLVKILLGNIMALVAIWYELSLSLWSWALSQHNMHPISIMYSLTQRM